MQKEKLLFLEGLERKIINKLKYKDIGSDVIKESLLLCIDRSKRLETSGFCVFGVYPAVAQEKSLLEEFCDKVIELKIKELYVSEYCFTILWMLLKKGYKVDYEDKDSVMETQEENWPAKYKMIKLKK